MGTCAYLAELLRYPAPRRLESLQAGLSSVSEAPVRSLCAEFLRRVSGLSLGEWEELYTAALDMNPSVAPYLGYQTWGESYPRGEFLSKLNRELVLLEIDFDGELPDHLIPVLRYLEVSPQPLRELLEIIEPALQRSAGVLRRADPKNPYNQVFDAVLLAVHPLAARAAQP